jgi:hypothetical protein
VYSLWWFIAETCKKVKIYVWLLILLCTYVGMYTYRWSKCALRGNVKRRLPELSNFPPYGELFVVIYLCHYCSSFIIFYCGLKLSDQRKKTTAKINCQRRKSKQGLWARILVLFTVKKNQAIRNLNPSTETRRAFCTVLHGFTLQETVFL